MQLKRDDSYKKFLRNQNDKTCRDYKILKNAVTNAKRNAKHDFLCVKRVHAPNTSGGASNNVLDLVKSSRL